MYYSGDYDGDRSTPEAVLGPGANVMLSYFDYDRQEGKTRDLENVHSHFFDSGAYTLKLEAERYAKETGCGRHDYYDTRDFWEYLERYAAFVKAPPFRIDRYVNLDVTTDPVRSRHHLEHLRQRHGLDPVPVIHYPEDPDEWLRPHLAEGCDLIGLGCHEDCPGWWDRCFNIICDTPDRLPRVKVHGFGVMSLKMLWRYPFSSVDASNGVRLAGNGCILVPPRRDGAFDFRAQPYCAHVSDRDGGAPGPAPPRALALRIGEPPVREWLRQLGIPHGARDPGGEVAVAGVSNCYHLRRIANLIYYEKVRARLPEYPRPFLRRQSVQGL